MHPLICASCLLFAAPAPNAPDAVAKPAAPATAEAAPAAFPKVVVVGIDGASWNLVDPYIAAGVTPTLGALTREGARGELASFWPLRTPQVWTSVVTGKLPGQHGIWDHVSNSAYNPPPFRTAKRKAVTSRERRSKALWQLLDAAGLSSLVVGWISTYPAEQLPHLAMAAPALFASDKRQSSIKGTFWRDVPEQVSPATLWPDVQRVIVEPSQISDAELAPFAEVPPAGSPIYGLPFMERYVYALRWSLARARSVEAITAALAARSTPDVALFYFQCSDSLLHRFWIFKESEAAIDARLRGHKIRTDLVPELKRRFGRVADACYRDIDERVGRLLTQLRGPETLVLVVSDHGFGDAPVPHPSRDEPYGGNHRDLGLIIAAGPQIPAGSTIADASVLDVTPTLLHLLGQPVGDDMRGKILPELVGGAEALRARPPTRVPSFEAVPQLEAPFAEGYPPRKKRPLAVDQ